MACPREDQASCPLAGSSFASSVGCLREVIPRVSLSRLNVAMFVALGMAEIVSAVPTSGGPYFWAAILAPRGQAAFWSWITGWCVILS